MEIVRESIKPTHMGKKLSPETMELVFHFGFEKVDGQVAVMGACASAGRGKSCPGCIAKREAGSNSCS